MCYPELQDHFKKENKIYFILFLFSNKPLAPIGSLSRPNIIKGNIYFIHFFSNSFTYLNHFRVTQGYEHLTWVFFFIFIFI